MAIESEGVVGKDVGFTPGPWKVEFGLFNGVEFDNNCAASVASEGPEAEPEWFLAAIHNDVPGGDATCYANAALIAAAPTLLEALRAVTEAGERYRRAYDAYANQGADPEGDPDVEREYYDARAAWWDANDAATQALAPATPESPTQ